MTNEKKLEWWERPAREMREPWPQRHPETGECGEWQGFYLEDGELTERGYTTDEVWVPMCCVHICYLPCQACMAAPLGNDEGAEA